MSMSMSMTELSDLLVTTDSLTQLVTDCIHDATYSNPNHSGSSSNTVQYHCQTTACLQKFKSN